MLHDLLQYVSIKRYIQRSLGAQQLWTANESLCKVIPTTTVKKHENRNEIVAGVTFFHRNELLSRVIEFLCMSLHYYRLSYVSLKTPQPRSFQQLLVAFLDFCQASM